MGRGQGTAGDGSTAGRTDLARFESFYDFAFPRVYRFAAKRMGTEARAEALTELILVSALTSLGGARGPENGLRGDPAELAFQLFAIARRVADEVEDDPSLLGQVAGARASVRMDDATGAAAADAASADSSLPGTGSSTARVPLPTGSRSRDSDSPKSS